MTERYYGEHAFEDLMSRADVVSDAWTPVSDLAAEFHINLDILTAFILKHLEGEHYDEKEGTVSPDGADALRTFLSPSGDEHWWEED